jgi:hypothetical protein
MRSIQWASIVCFAFAAGGCVADTAGSGEPAELGTDQEALAANLAFPVDFTNCTEMASLTPVPVAAVRSLVPSSYALANEAAGTTFIVVRIANCQDTAVAGHATGAGTVAQVGVNLVSPDGTGDINNYTLWYYTTNARLFARLRAIGVSAAQFVPNISYNFVSTGAGTGNLQIAVPGCPSFTVGGPVVVPTAAAVPFTANWWQDSRRGSVRMNTPIPAIQFSTATMTLHTSRSSELGEILGASTATFPIFDSYNTFPSAHMNVAYR